MTDKKIGIFIYGRDWRAEPTLAICSEGARLLWWEMLLLMSESEVRGHLLVSGRRPTPKEIAALTRTDPEKVDERLAELETNRVFSRLKNGTIISRRIVRDENVSRKNRANGSKGGNPNLRKDTEKQGSLIQADKPSRGDLPGPSPGPSLEEETEELVRTSSSPPCAPARERPQDDDDDEVTPSLVGRLAKAGQADPAEVRELAQAWTRATGSAGLVEGMILDALRRNARDPIGYIAKTVRDHHAQARAPTMTTQPEQEDRITRMRRWAEETDAEFERENRDRTVN